MIHARFQERLRILPAVSFAILAALYGHESHADDFRASRPVETADAIQESGDSRLPQFDLEIDFNFGGLKPVDYTQPLWVPTAQPVDAPPIEEATIPPAPPELEPIPDPSVESKTQVEIVEEDVDLRVPDVDSAEGEVEIEAPSWMNPFIDDHISLWHENREGLEILFHDDDGFGMTTLAFGAKIHDEDGPMWANLKFAWHFLKGPLQPDIRSQTYDLTFEINHAEQLNDIWGVHLQLSPTWATDWDNKSHDAFRFIGGGMLTMQYDEGVHGPLRSDLSGTVLTFQLFPRLESGLGCGV